MAAALTPPITSVEEYLHTAYRPDVDFVDGVLEERNVGEFDHAMLQRALLLALIKNEKLGGYLVVQELRVQISATRYRVPDTCVLKADRLPDQIVREAPLLCIEVLSPEDRVQRLQRRCQDYLDMGVPEVWVLNPLEKTAMVVRGNMTTIHKTGTLRVEGTAIELSLDEIFGSFS